MKGWLLRRGDQRLLSDSKICHFWPNRAGQRRWCEIKKCFFDLINGWMDEVRSIDGYILNTHEYKSWRIHYIFAKDRRIRNTVYEAALRNQSEFLDSKIFVCSWHCSYFCIHKILLKYISWLCHQNILNWKNKVIQRKILCKRKSMLLSDIKSLMDYWWTTKQEGNIVYH